MEPQQIGKRKKRRTRKCLDELRKRSRTSYTAATFLESKHKVHKLNNNCVTLDRLTLNLVHKAVRSETITRPVLAEIKNNPNLMLDDLVKVNISCSSDGKILEISNIDPHHSTNSNQTSHRPIKTEVSYSFKTINVKDQDDKSSDKTQKNNPIEVVFAPVTTITAPCSQDNYEYSLYKEFMNEISTYLKQTSLDLFNENVKNGYKALLQNLFLNQKDKRKCDNNILKSNLCQKYKSYTPRETIIQNPVDYIRHAQLGYSSLATEHKREHSESLSDSTSTPSTPFATHSLHESTNLSTSIVLYETPEYIYYPHKLNQ